MVNFCTNCIVRIVSSPNTYILITLANISGNAMVVKSAFHGHLLEDIYSATYVRLISTIVVVHIDRVCGEERQNARGNCIIESEKKKYEKFVHMRL